MRILFMGTPDLAAESLGALIAAGHEIVGVFTRADKPVGRKQVLTAPPVKQLAVQHGIPVWQPATLRDGEAEKVFRALQPDLVVVVAYGRILPPELLHIAPLGCINLHVSLLPKYRGSAPIQWAVLNGDRCTGVSIMQLDEGLDTGDMLLKGEVEITKETTGGSLHDALAEIGAELIVQYLDNPESFPPQKQDDSLTCYAAKIDKTESKIDFSLPAETLEESYDKEYGKDTIQIHKDAITEDDVVLLHDDLLATGGTMNAAYRLTRKFNPKDVFINFLSIVSI